MATEYMTLLGIGIQTALYLLAGYAMVIRSDGSIKTMSKQVDGMQTKLDGLAVIVTTLAVQDERLNTQSQRLNQLEQRIEALRRGEGFVAGARGVEKEY